MLVPKERAASRRTTINYDADDLPFVIVPPWTGRTPNESIAEGGCGQCVDFALFPHGRLQLGIQAGGVNLVTLRNPNHLPSVVDSAGLAIRPTKCGQRGYNSLLPQNWQTYKVSQWVGFFAEGRLKKTRLEGGDPIPLCDAPAGRGGSWGEDGNIIAALDQQAGLSLIPAEGGAPVAVTQLNLDLGETTHRWPQVLPGTERLSFS
jgi:hypothetical protein